MDSGEVRQAAEREKAIMRTETARRLIPPTDLTRSVERHEPIEPISVRSTADGFDIDEETAYTVPRLLTRRRRPGWNAHASGSQAVGKRG